MTFIWIRGLQAKCILQKSLPSCFRIFCITGYNHEWWPVWGVGEKWSRCTPLHTNRSWYIFSQRDVQKYKKKKKSFVNTTGIKRRITYEKYWSTFCLNYKEVTKNTVANILMPKPSFWHQCIYYRPFYEQTNSGSGCSDTDDCPVIPNNICINMHIYIWPKKLPKLLHSV